MDHISLERNIRLLVYICKIKFPQYAGYYFPIFVIIQRIKKLQYDLQYLTLPLKVIPIPNNLYNVLVRDETVKSEHILFVSESIYQRYMTRKNFNLINFSFITGRVQSSTDDKNGDDIVSRILNKPINGATLFHLLPIRTSQFSAVFMMENTYSNLIDKYKIDTEKIAIYSKLQKMYDQQSLPQIASKANIFMINAPYDLSSDINDFIITKYFEQPRLIYRNHTYLISLDEEFLGNHMFTRHFHIFSSLKKLYFKCVNIESQDNSFELYGIVVKSLTNLHQMTSINYFVPKQIYDSLSYVRTYPNGLKKYFNELKKAIIPFLKKNSTKSPKPSEPSEILLKRGIFPLFMMQGERGSGKLEIIQAVADDLGIQLYNGDCAEIISSISAQTESKLSNVLNKSNVCEPLIICLQNFENFGLDNEGNEDYRIINAFQTEIHKLFSKKHNLSIIIVAISNSKSVKPKIGCLFLEIIKIPILSTTERFEILKWFYMKEKYRTYTLSQKRTDPIVLYKNFESMEINKMLFKISEECHGFLYGDIKLLFENSFRNMENESETLKYEDLMDNLKKMQASFSDSLGAPKVPKVLWSEIGGLTKLKTEIQNSIGLPLKHKHLMGNMRRSGILLYGPPGTGKTMIAKAVATECKMNFLSVQGPELLNMYVGQSEQNVREVFDRARAASPCVIFLDELDSLAPNRGVAGDSGGVMDRVVSQLLSEMDGMSNDPDKQIFILAATNRPDLIDPALLRPGRFDKLVYAGPCTTTEAKQAILQTITNKFKLSKDLSIDKIAELLINDMTGADLYSICSNAWLSAVRRTVKKSAKQVKLKPNELSPSSVIVTLDDFKMAITKFIPSISKSDLQYFNELKTQYS